MNVVILGVLSTKFAATAGGFLTGFLLLLALLLLRRRVQVRMRPLLVTQTLRPMDQTWLPARANTRCLSMASRAPPPRVLKRQWMRRNRTRPTAALRS